MHDYHDIRETNGGGGLSGSTKAVALAALVFVIAQIARAEPVATGPDYAPFFADLERADRLASEGRISHCSAFSYILDRLYQARGFDPRLTLSDAAIFLADTPVVYERMGRGARSLMFTPMRAQGKAVHATLVSRFEGAMPEQLSTPKRFAQWVRSGTYRGAPAVAAFKAEAVRAAIGGENPGHAIPAWLSDHAGIDPAARDKAVAEGSIHQASGGEQARGRGYRQDGSDDDATGRHDHLLGNMILGYVGESTIAGDRGTSTAREGFFARLGGFFRKVTSEAMMNLAPVADEYLSLDQNGSSTDVKVNKSGVLIGQWMAELQARGEKPAAGELGRRVFDAVCDESKLEGLAHPGPLAKLP